jgi:cbb3-type cytochrome oxidase subunit 1
MPFWHIRAGGASMMLTGMFLFAFNIYKTASAPVAAATEEQIRISEGRPEYA